MPKRELPSWPRLFLALLLLCLLASAGCKVVAREDRQSDTSSTPRRTEQLIIEHLAKVYEQPRNWQWEEGKAYFLPEKHGVELLHGSRPGTNLQGLKVYKAAVWSVHWGPEKFPVLVWAVGNEGEPKLGVLEGPDEVAERFPVALHGMVFESPETRRDLALLIGEMVDVFYSESSTGGLNLVPEGNCEWAERSQAPQGTLRRIAASCFSEGGVLERIVLAQRGGS